MDEQKRMAALELQVENGQKQLDLTKYERMQLEEENHRLKTHLRTEQAGHGYWHKVATVALSLLTYVITTIITFIILLHNQRMKEVINPIIPPPTMPKIAIFQSCR